MKKTLLLLGFAAFFAQNVQAQHIKIGAEVGVNMNKMNFDLAGITNQSLVGARAGLTSDIGIGPISIQPGIFYAMKGGETSFLGFSQDKTTLNYIEIPVWIQYKHKLGPGKAFIGVAPSVSFGISGKDRSTGIDSLGTPVITKESVTFGSGTNDVKRLDYAANFNVGYELGFGLFARIFYSLGLANISNDPISAVKNRTFGVSVGYLFGK